MSQQCKYSFFKNDECILNSKNTYVPTTTNPWSFSKTNVPNQTKDIQTPLPPPLSPKPHQSQIPSPSTTTFPFPFPTSHSIQNISQTTAKQSQRRCI